MREMVVKHLGDREDAMRDELETVQMEMVEVKGEGKELNDIEETTLKMLQVSVCNKISLKNANPIL